MHPVPHDLVEHDGTLLQALFIEPPAGERRFHGVLEHKWQSDNLHLLELAGRVTGQHPGQIGNPVLDDFILFERGLSKC